MQRIRIEYVTEIRIEKTKVNLYTEIKMQRVIFQLDDKEIELRIFRRAIKERPFDGEKMVKERKRGNNGEKAYVYRYMSSNIINCINMKNIKLENKNIREKKKLIT